ncbi:MAG: cation diffusion facilitator family transporter [Candidatus Helarchaeota archaeon]
MNVEKKLTLAALVILFIKLLLFFIKFFTGFIINSTALIADSINSASDVISGIAILIGITLSQKKPTEKFPYGFHKVENFAELFISFGIFYACYEIIIRAIESLLETNSFLETLGLIGVNDVNFGILISLISIIISIFLALYLRRVGSQTKAPSIIAEAKDATNDIITITTVFVGIFGYYINLSILEPVASLIIVIFVFKSGIDIFIHSAKVLLDAILNFEQFEGIKDITQKTPGVVNVKSIKARSSGRFVFIEMEIQTFLKTLDAVDKLTHDIESKLKLEYPEIDSVLIHAEPLKKETIKCAIPLTDNVGIDSELSEHFGGAKYFLLFDLNKGTILNLEYKENPYVNLERQKGIKTMEWLSENSVDRLYATKAPGGGAALMAETKYIEVITTKFKMIKQLLENLKTQNVQPKNT